MRIASQPVRLAAHHSASPILSYQQGPFTVEAGLLLAHNTRTGKGEATRQIPKGPKRIFPRCHPYNGTAKERLTVRLATASALSARRDFGNKTPEAVTSAQTLREVVRTFFGLVGHGFTIFDRGGI